MNQALDPTLIEDIVSDHGQWQAYLRLRFAQRSRGTRLVASEHQGPLYVQKAFYPEGPDCAHAYLLHPPGGLVTGDTLDIDIQVDSGSEALITTPGAGRVYKARDDSGVQTQNMTLRVESDAVLEWLPLETILFPKSHARMNTQVELAEGAKVMAWEVTCFGLPANNLAFEDGSCEQRLQIWQQGRIRFNEALSLAPGDTSVLHGKGGLQEKPVNALFVAGPFNETIDSAEHETMLEALLIKQSGMPGDDLLALSMTGEFLTVRYLGNCTERARNLLGEAWALVRPVLSGRKATEPRIWLT
jgi:urease accessory protein